MIGTIIGVTAITSITLDFINSSITFAIWNKVKERKPKPKYKYLKYLEQKKAREK